MNISVQVFFYNNKMETFIAEVYNASSFVNIKKQQDI